ncbi:MAG TPA: DciA family protein [Rickettsiales bacterium]|nr:DciA family protein [Rickettsiales bacterium]
MKDINFVIRDVIKPITKNYSPVLLILMRNWQNIMGEKYYEFCEVEKVSFPKNKKIGGIIHIIAFNNVISFYIENNKSFILEKMNAIFGYGLLSDIKIKQLPKLVKQHKNNPIKLDTKDEKAIDNLTSKIDDNELKKSLNDLGRVIFGEK